MMAPAFQAGRRNRCHARQGSNRGGYINLSLQKAQRLTAWDEIEKAYNEKNLLTPS